MLFSFPKVFSFFFAASKILFRNYKKERFEGIALSGSLINDHVCNLVIFIHKSCLTCI